MVTETNAQPGWGIFWMATTGLLFVGVTALVKILGTRIPAAEAAFLRYVLGLVFLIPMLGTLSRIRLPRATWGLFIARGVAHSLGVGLWFYAMSHIPIADVTAMNYLSPIYVTLGAALFLKEKLALRRIIAIVMALIGTLIILRPGLRELAPGHFAMLFTAIAFGASYLLAKVLAEKCSAGLVVAMLSITVAIGLAPVALSQWVTPTLWELVILFGVAALATGGHYTMTLAFASAPLAVTQPVTFLQMVWAVLLGVTFFAEPFDFWVIVGALVIVGSISFMSWREAVIKRQTITPTTHQTKI